MRARRGERGETLIEVVVAASIMGVSIVVLVGALAAAVANATRQRTDATAQTILNSFAERARDVAFIPCATPAEYNLRLGEPAAPPRYTRSITSIASWDGTSYASVHSKLTAPVAVGATTIEVADASTFPAASPTAPIDIKVGAPLADSGSTDPPPPDPERLTVTGVSGTTLTLKPGSPTTAAHAIDDDVTACPPEQYQAQLLGVTVTGPASPGSGDAYTDTMSVAKRGPLKVPSLTAAAPVVTTPVPPAEVRAGAPVTLDVAATIDGTSPTGDVTFSLYAPDQYDDTTGVCTGTPVVPPLTAPVADSATAHPMTFTPARAGIYRWVVAYSGDAANEGVTTACGGDGQSTKVEKAEPTLTVSLLSPIGTPPTTTVGSTTDARATLVGGATPTGELTFELHGPEDDDCTGAPIAQLPANSQPITDNGQHTSLPFTFTEPGTYRWQASFEGDADSDARNVDPPKTACPTEANETVTVTEP